MTETGSKIRSGHLDREAWVYVRQSTMTQVQRNNESTQLQYRLVERAVMLGWVAESVRVVDEDMGRSGKDASNRKGFQSLLAAVGLGRVGVVLGIEVSRLARNNADWYQLLDLCAMTDTLIADADGLYHPADYNDRLVLGLKGTMSEAELHLLRSRLNAGLRNKAARGALRQGLPVGYEYDEDNSVILNRDEAVQAAIGEVFSRFDQLRSARQVVVSMRDDGLLLPRRGGGTRRVRWDAASYPAVHDFLTNPAYAGAFVFGRTKQLRRARPDGTIGVTTVDVPVDAWEICIHDHHPGYVSWETYLATLATLRANWRGPNSEAAGAAREGPALLQGLVRCGRCGRRMQVGYSNRGKTRYICHRALILYGAHHACQSVGGRRLEAVVLAAVFDMLEPAAITATLAGLDAAEAAHAERSRAFELGAERARYEAERARRQFDACEPENRLVARTLERDWEGRLAAQRRAEADLAAQRLRQPSRLSEEELGWLQHAGADLHAVFNAPTTTIRERKLLLRALIDHVQVTVDHPAATARGHIVWEGGAVTEITMTLPRRADYAPSHDPVVVDLIGQLLDSHSDEQIAVELNRRGLPPVSAASFNARIVAHIRRTRNMSRSLPTRHQSGKYLTLLEAQSELGVSRASLHRWLTSGFITGHQDDQGRWLVRIDDDLQAKITDQLPTGWARIPQAATATGVSTQTIRDRINRGELEVIQVRNGRHVAQAVRLPAHTDLFNQAN